MLAFKHAGHPIIVLRGNHRWMAYNLLHTKYCLDPAKIKELMLDSVLAVVYWWPNLSEHSINEMRALAMHHNAEGECHVPMTFWDEVRVCTPILFCPF